MAMPLSVDRGLPDQDLDAVESPLGGIARVARDVLRLDGNNRGRAGMRFLRRAGRFRNGEFPVPPSVEAFFVVLLDLQQGVTGGGIIAEDEKEQPALRNLGLDDRAERVGQGFDVFVGLRRLGQDDKLTGDIGSDARSIGSRAGRGLSPRRENQHQDGRGGRRGDGRQESVQSPAFHRFSLLLKDK